ncbi:hypothetical protein Fot_22827 [Forsythia ovata]|uniref:Uncharacterized protein n=1 Tax=Forsythia ovata TaxID=205694 RepID=A0ABD1UZ67_9LAMI
MGSTNTKLSSENEVLRSHIEVLISNEAVLKIKINATVEDARRAEMMALEAQSARRQAKKSFVTTEQIVALVNRDFDAMVLEKDKQLAEVMDELERAREELATLKASMAEAEKRTVMLYKKEFLGTPEYKCLATCFMEAWDDQLMEKI